MPLLGLSLIIQIALIVHVFRTGRPVYWAFIIFFLGPIGPIAYFLVELLPEWVQGYQGQKAVNTVRKALDPGGEIRRQERQHRLSGSVDAARRLARELTDHGRYEEAIERYEDALTGLYEHDADLLAGLAEAQFGNGEYENAKATLARLTAHNPEYRSPETHLLYARTLEECGELEEAEQEYEEVSAYFAGAEARVRYAQLLEKLERPDEALEQYEEVLASAELAPRHYRRAQRRWIGEARNRVKQLRG